MRVQHPLIPFLEKTISDPITPFVLDLIVVLETLRVEDVVYYMERSSSVGAPVLDRAALLRAFIAKDVLKISTTEALVDRLRVDGALRQICGWEFAPAAPPSIRTGITESGKRLAAKRRQTGKHARRGVPSLATFSRAFAEFAEARVLDQVHALRVTEYLGADVFEQISYDGTAITAREKPVRKVKTDSTETTAATGSVESAPVTDSAVSPTRRRKKRRKKEEPIPDQTRLQKQRASSDTSVRLAESLPTACDVGTKQNSKGYKESWNGYKMHMGTVSGDIPVVALTTSASMHDSGAAIPLMRMVRERQLKVKYELMDSAYDAKEIYDESKELGRVPIIDKNLRRGAAEEKRLEQLPFSRINVDHALVDIDRRRRFRDRTCAERVNARLKENNEMRSVRVRGHPKVHATLMISLLVQFSKGILCL